MQEYTNTENEERKFPFQDFERHRARKRFGFGVLILVIGVLILFKQLGFGDIFPIHTFWPFILIVIGVIIGLRTNFRTPAPFILIIIGALHAIPSFSFHIGDHIVYSQRLVVPVLMIGAGLFFLFVKKKVFRIGDM